MTMGERMMKIETKLDDHTAQEERYQLLLSKQIDELICKIDKLDEKYSSKWVERAVIVIYTGITVSVITGLIILL